MSGRRDSNEGDEGEAGIRLLNQLVRTRLLVSVRAGQDNVETNLLRYTYVNVSPLFVPRLRRFIYAIGGQGVAQMGTWLQFHQAPRAASAAICAGVVVGALGDAATPEIVAGLIACRTDQILPAIEQYLYKQKGLARGDVD